MLYKILFEFHNLLGRWISDDLSNDGKGFTREDAEHIAQDLSRRSGIRNVRVVPL